MTRDDFGVGDGHRTPLPADVAKARADHELGGAVAASFSHFRNSRGERRYGRRLEGRGPPEILLHIVNYISHR